MIKPSELGFSRRLGGAGIRRGIRGPARAPGGSGGSSPVDPTVYGLNSLSAANCYISSSTAGLVGLPGGAAVGLAFMFGVESQAVASANRTLGGTWASSIGQFMRTTGTNTGLQYVYGGGSAPGSYTITAGDVGKIMMGFAWYVANPGASGLWVNRASVSSASPGGSVTFTPAQLTYLGKRSDGAGADNIRIYGWAEFSTASGAPSAANIQAYYDAVKAAADIVDTATGFTITNSWSVKRSQSGSAPNTLTDYAGSGAVDLAKSGTPTLVSNATPTWGW